MDYAKIDSSQPDSSDDKYKWGYINTKGDVVIPFGFDHARPFSEGLAPVAIKKLFGYINKDGRLVISPHYTVAGAFSGGLAAVRTGGTTEYMYMRPAMRQPGGTWTFIGADSSKKINLPKTTVEARDFAEGLAAIYLDDDRCGYVNASGSMVVSPAFSYCDDFSESLALVLSNEKLKYIDKEGRLVLDTPYDNGRSFKNGLASVEEGISGPEQKFGYINKQGKEVWKPRPAL